MSETKLISYITSDFQTKSDMIVGETEWIKIMNEKYDEFKSAGAIRQTVTQIWNKEGSFRRWWAWRGPSRHRGKPLRRDEVARLL